MNKSRIVNFLAGLAVGVSMMTPVQADQWTARHTFDIGNVQGDFEGRTFGGTTTSDGTIPADTTILCGGAGMAACPEGVSPMVDRKLYGKNNPITLYPIDSDFGYYIIDFLGAAQKTRDDDYLEGFIGDVPPAYFPTEALIDGEVIMFNEDPETGKYPPILGGVAISNAATDTYKVKPPMGTWCRGLGGLSVKCETEHYSVMEHILSCHELIPYFFADPVTGTQAVLNPGSADIPTLDEYDCANAGLDDIALIMIDGMLGGATGDVQLVNGTPCEDEGPPGEDCQLFPNDKTDVNNNVALTDDYSVQLKDDGKALYGWGTMHKRPNDVRIYASLELPEEWKGGANYTINSAKLVVRHHITNNPNDQLRPEDLENEAATGRKPSYRIENMGAPNEVWKSTKACFEGDGDLIDDEFGVIDPDFLDIGTVFKNAWFAITESPPVSNVPTNSPDLPYPLSSDLREAMTNAWYTTVDRAPFEWSYDPDGDLSNDVQDFVGSWLEDPSIIQAGGILVSGPRWRLRPNKYGQDLPGLEVALVPLPGEGTDGADCYSPPFESSLIKYPVGDPTITEINLLDWDTEGKGPSPLATSSGWVDVTQNGFVEIVDYNNGVPYTTNGLPMSDNFDLAVYVKGDRKPTAVYDAYLVIDYDAVPTNDVPYVVGLTQAEAVAIITSVEYGLTVGTVTTASSDTVEAGLVISQDPEACVACVVAGAPVDLVISSGTLIMVPFIGPCSTTADATQAINDAGLTVNPVNIEEESGVCDAGLVLRTVPSAGTEVEDGSEVTLVVATEPVILSDVTIRKLTVPTYATTFASYPVSVRLQNASSAGPSGPGIVTVTGSDGTVFTAGFANIDPGEQLLFAFTWTPDTRGKVIWDAEVTISGVVVDTARKSSLVLY